MQLGEIAGEQKADLVGEDFLALVALFEARFTQAELRRWLANVPDGLQIVRNLPETANLATFTHEAADIIKRYGTYKTAKFWDEFEKAAGEVEAPKVRALRIRVGAPAGAPLVSHSDQPIVPAQLTVLLVSATPEGRVRLRVDAEFRDIIDKVAHGRAHDRIRFEQVHAARVSDLRSALINHKPHVLHISSHGEDDGSLQFENRHTTGTQAISKERLLDLIDALNERIRLVVLNACDSAAQCDALRRQVDCVVGMEGKLEITGDAIAAAPASGESSRSALAIYTPAPVPQRAVDPAAVSVAADPAAWVNPAQTRLAHAATGAPAWQVLVRGRAARSSCERITGRPR